MKNFSKANSHIKQIPGMIFLIYFIMVPAILLMICFSANASEKFQKKSHQAFTVLFFNDIHGHLQPFKVKTDAGEKEVGGVARLATLIKNIKSENDDLGAKTFVLIAGDILQGTLMSTIFHGEPDIACFNHMGVDAITIGNHEFDFGLDNLNSLRSQAKFPFLSANIVQKENYRPLADAGVELPITKDLNLTVIGVTTKDLKITTNPVNVKTLDVQDPVSATISTFKCSPGKGPVILLSHCDHATDSAIAKAMPELTAIIGGHNHLLLSPCQRIGTVPIFQAFENGRFLGRIDFQMDTDTGKTILKGYRYIPVTKDIFQDPIVLAKVTRYRQKLDKRFYEVIGKATKTLDGERKHIRWQETTLGNFITDVMRRQTGSQIALINAGAIRASINSGNITMEEIFRSIPFTNELITIQLTGKELAAVLSRAYHGKQKDEDGGFLQISGLQVKLSGQDISCITIGPKHMELNPKEIYSTVITDFLYAGGDGYTIFKDKPAVHTGLPLRELIIEEIQRLKVINQQKEGRIVRL